jgi:hypothetical protein
MLIQLFNQLSRVTYISGISDVSPVELQYSTDLSKNALNVTLYSKYSKLVPHRSLPLPSDPFRFWLEFAEIFVIEKLLPNSGSRRLSDLASRRLSDLASRGVADSPRRGVAIWMYKRKLPTLVCRRVVDPQLAGFWMFKRKLPTLVSRRVVDPRLAESKSRYGESGSHYSNF